MSNRKPNNLARGNPVARGSMYAACARAVETGDADGVGLVVTNDLRQAVSDRGLRELIAAGIVLFDALGRELYFNGRGDLIPVDPTFTPGIA